jgi:hypothetical protein
LWFYDYYKRRKDGLHSSTGKGPMAKKNDNGVNKSEEIRQLLKANPKITPKEVVTKFAEKGIEVSPALFYFVKGQIKGGKLASRRLRTMSPKSQNLRTPPGPMPCLQS